ncbi:hypothetical protein J0A67_20690 [Algoriphagus aestuariicola]|uniref:FUSC family protein n=1 Tax=Algoriphagus aestuariicola TaxID=1852016 RepID=A0ABS3BVQ2_9BACT|nr:hypothetical protein [Algoriphagus aestuariicola]MBN7803306.1 hypothetical protein [Algoriphagus aestuariicola]
MEKKNYSGMTDAELLLEKKNFKTSRLLHAAGIGFLAGIVVFGFGAWILSSDRSLGFLIPMFFPILFIYKMLKNPKQDDGLMEVLKARGLN